MPKKKDGTKTIKLALYFWTNLDKKNEANRVQMPKKTCWDSGYVDVVSNNLHGIRSGTMKNFNNIEEIPNAVMDVFKRSGIKAVRSSKDKEYKEALKKMKESEL